MKRLLFRLFLFLSFGVTVASGIPLIFLIVFQGYCANNFFFWLEPECVAVHWEDEDAGGEMSRRYGLVYTISSPDSVSNVYCKVFLRHRNGDRIRINLDSVEAGVRRNGKICEMAYSIRECVFPLTFPDWRDTPETGFAAATELTIPLEGSIRPERWSDVLSLSARFTISENGGKTLRGIVSGRCKSSRTGEIFR